jgi:hypothetical protein
LTFLGVLISYLSLLVAGIGQGILLANAGNSFAGCHAAHDAPGAHEHVGRFVGGGREPFCSCSTLPVSWQSAAANAARSERGRA